MSSAAEEIHGVGFDDYLQNEQAGARRHELVGGRVYLMAGGSERHDLMAGLVYEALAPGARTAGCRPFTSNRMLRAAQAAYYPDVLVVCGPAWHRLYERDATVIVDVPSPSTESTDRREKASAYALLPGLRLYVLVDPDRRRMEAARPDGGTLAWQAYGPGDVLTTPYGDLDVDALYDVVDATASRP